ncbi:hypothetical protein C8J56DRAFT_919078 [Mycena floridula]|nr:hypothetical protein C8J56DRAFT_919078 [Mycena floridula]
MEEYKPLPAIPPTVADLTSLSVDARSHRGAFIHHILSQETSQIQGHEVDVWARAFEDSLDQLSAAIVQDAWLAGIKRANVERRSKERPADAEENENLSQEKAQRLRDLTSKSSIPTPLPVSKHLLLCLAPLGSRIAVPEEDSGFDLIPATIGCSFKSATFTSEESTWLYGYHELDTTSSEDLKLVGGTFGLKGVTSPLQYHALTRCLRVFVYIHLALILEQHLLADFHVPIQFPKVTPRPQALSVNTSFSSTGPASAQSRNRNSFLPNSILSFFSKRNVRAPATPTTPRSGSLDLNSTLGVSPPSSDVGSRIRRFSLISDGSSFIKSSPSKEEEPPFQLALNRVQQSKEFLSSSVGIAFEPPSLLVDIALKEKNHPNMRLKGDERTGLTTILGWDGKDSQGKGMSGLLGFVRQQEISVLVSNHLPLPSISEIPSVSSAASVERQRHRYATCGNPKWVTFRYYKDKVCLGEYIEGMVKTAETKCGLSCTKNRGNHEMRYMHGEIRLVVTVNSDSKPSTDTEIRPVIEVWMSCSTCEARSERSAMSDATYLLPFGKFLELLIYSPALCTTVPPLCEHTSPPSTSLNSSLPKSRLNILRHFSLSTSPTPETTTTTTVTFQTTELGDVFELRVPRLQIIRGNGDPPRNSLAESLRNSLSQDDNQSHHQSASDSTRQSEVHDGTPAEKRLLRREIRRWWEGVSDHIDKLEDKLAVEDNMAAFRKALPRLPSEDDAYDDYDYQTVKKPVSKISGLPVVPGSPRSLSSDYFSQSSSSEVSSSASSISSSTSSISSALSTPHLPASSPGETSQIPSEPTKPPAVLLTDLRQSFQRTEQSLYALLSRTAVTCLNDVRREFLRAGITSELRLDAWQEKHLSKKKSKKADKEKMALSKPEWWDKTCHVAPGGNIIVREGDWGSIIAFTMSTAAYHEELKNMALKRPASTAPETPAASPGPNVSSFLTTSAAKGYNKLFRNSALSQLDPDQEDAIWHEPEDFSAVISRKEHPKDPTSILSIREVLRQKTPTSEGILSPSLFLSIGSGSTSSKVSTAPPSAWAKADVQVSKQMAGGEVSGPPMADLAAVSKMLERETSSDTDHHDDSKSNLGFSNAHIKRGKASSVISDSADSDTTVGPDAEQPTTPTETSKPTGSMFSNPFSSGFTNVMRFMNSNTDFKNPHQSATGSECHGLLSSEGAPIDDRPHIKYDWTVGKRLKFSCTIYFARQFDSLRKRCGVEDVFIKSLSESANWAAEGGKSKSNFWKTADDRFIIKTLVNAWNVADLQVLIDMAPSYFKYMDATANKPTVLAKLIGFYTVEIRNLETGAVQSKSDLLVMENLFYAQKVGKTFDLKGIQGRKVKAAVGAPSLTTRTLFDGEWIEGQQHTLTLIRHHSKAVLKEAIKSDAGFLASMNVMDYSLLLGVDEERKQIACGLVDTIGSYTFAKTLEYKAKQGLNSGNGKEVTVIPPAEYQERFVTALEGYFVACPDKWSRSMDASRSISDPAQLPSIL